MNLFDRILPTPYMRQRPAHLDEIHAQRRAAATTKRMMLATHSTRPVPCAASVPAFLDALFKGDVASY